MQTVTRRFSASPTICAERHRAVGSGPARRPCPRGFPEKQMTLGRPASAQALIALDHTRDHDGVVLQAVQAVRDPGDAVGHRAGEAVALHDGPVGRVEQLDRRQADPLALPGEVIERDLLVAPAARRVAGTSRRCRRSGKAAGRAAPPQGGRAGQSLQRSATGDVLLFKRYAFPVGRKRLIGGWGGAVPLGRGRRDVQRPGRSIVVKCHFRQ
jgi:hypothetical protein